MSRYHLRHSFGADCNETWQGRGMGFNQSTITRVNPPVQYGTQLLLSWTSSSPEGTLYQVYLNQQLVWSGVGLSCSIPMPSAISRIDIGDGRSRGFPDQLPVRAGPCRNATGYAFVARWHLSGCIHCWIPRLWGAHPRGRYRLHDDRCGHPGVRCRNHHGRVRLRRIRPGGIRKVCRCVHLDFGSAVVRHLELGRQSV